MELIRKDGVAMNFSQITEWYQQNITTNMNCVNYVQDYRAKRQSHTLLLQSLATVGFVEANYTFRII